MGPHRRQRDARTRTPHHRARWWTQHIRRCARGGTTPPGPGILPTNGDSRHVVGGSRGTPATVSGRDRPPTVAYLGQIARAAEDLGCVGALPPPAPGARRRG